MDFDLPAWPCKADAAFCWEKATVMSRPADFNRDWLAELPPVSLWYLSAGDRAVLMETIDGCVLHGKLILHHLEASIDG